MVEFKKYFEERLYSISDRMENPNLSAKDKWILVGHFVEAKYGLIECKKRIEKKGERE